MKISPYVIRDPNKPVVVTNIQASNSVPFTKLGTGLIELNNISATVEALLAAVE